LALALLVLAPAAAYAPPSQQHAPSTLVNTLSSWRPGITPDPPHRRSVGARLLARCAESLQPRRNSPTIASCSVMLNLFTASTVRRRLGMPGLITQARFHTRYVALTEQRDESNRARRVWQDHEPAFKTSDHDAIKRRNVDFVKS
jgi:hypothetical protein